MHPALHDQRRRAQIETRLPMDPRTGDYIRRGGRSYRRDEVGPAWILERFPSSLERPER